MKGAMKACVALAVVMALASWAGCKRAEKTVSAGPGASEAKQGPLGWVDRLRVGEPAGHGNLLVFPVFAETPAIGAEYLTLDEGIRGKLVRVTEVAQRETPEQAKMSVAEIEAQLASQKPAEPGDVQGDVNKLLVHNHSRKPLFILAGQTVCGGKQDRICPEDVIVPPDNVNFELKVFCVEAGRWHVDSETTANFELADIAVDKVRKSAQAEKDQGKVWQRVSETRADARTAVGYDPDLGSGTDGYLEAASDPKLKAEVKPYVEALSGRWKDEKKLAGFVVAVDGRIRSVDVFNDAATFAKLRDQLLESYAARAVLAKAAPEKKPGDDKARAPGPPAPLTTADAEKFLKSAYAHRSELSTNQYYMEMKDGVETFGSAGGTLELNGSLQHIYMSVDKKKDAGKPPDDAKPAPPDVEEPPKK